MLISTPGITYYSVFLREFIVVGTIRNYYMQVIYIDRLLCSTIIYLVYFSIVEWKVGDVILQWRL